MTPAHAGTAPEPAAGAQHLKHIEGMRAVAALVVFVNHAFAQVWKTEGAPPPEGVFRVFGLSMVAGHLSVAVFIVISGFCLALPLLRNDGELGGTLPFLKRRARRILPPYYGALALALLLIFTVLGQPTGSIWDVAQRVTRVSVIAHVLLLQDLFGTGAINYVFWSIAVEFQIYLLFPLMVRAWKRYDFRAVVAVALVVGYALTFAFAQTRIYRANPHFIGLFVLGMLAAHVALSPSERYASVRDRTPWAWLAGLSALAALALTLAWGVDAAILRFPVLDLFTGVCTTSVLVLSSRSRTGVLRRGLSWAPLSFVGLFSYSLYLIHAPMLQLVWQYGLRERGLGPATTFSLLMTVGLALTLVASYGFFRVFEQPFMRSAGRARARLVVESELPSAGR